MNDVREPGALPPISGNIPIIVTPFRENEDIDLDALSREIRYLAEGGIRWVGIGFGSEVQKMTPEEVSTVVRVTRESDSRVHVIGNTDATSVRAARARLQSLCEDGAEAVLLRPPAIGGLGADALIDAFRIVAGGSPVPLIVQDAGDMTGVPLAAETLARLLTDIPEIAGAKVEAKDAHEKISQLRSRLGHRSAIILGGSGGASFARQLRRGADGTMPGPAFPEMFADIWAAHQRGDFPAARRAQAALLPFLQVGERSMDTFIYSQKFALASRGILKNTMLRKPHALERDSRLDAEFSALISDIEEAHASL